MDKTHPQRKKDKLNPYTLSIENNNYYVSFTDGQGIMHYLEISKDLYNTFNRFELDDISQINKIQRHLTGINMGDESLSHLTSDPSESLEDYVHRNIIFHQLHSAIAQLPVVQRRRLCLYYFEGYTYKEIAEMEGCKHPAVVKSIAAAKTKIRKKIIENL